ncbi:MAG: hypothetical protein AM324_005415 [Candidatus Thorarchaeota archaeon SMTZ1-83]|nr:MAG: hypothetical protein AM324_06655 [Candidatus Thorarchaeota archaeon SMTZ1-83]
MIWVLLVAVATVVVTALVIDRRREVLPDCRKRDSFAQEIFCSKVVDSAFFPLESKEYERAVTGSGIRGK